MFSTEGTFRLRCAGHEDVEYPELGIDDLRNYIAASRIDRDSILRIRVVHEADGQTTTDLKHSLDFIADNDRVVLTAGRWMRFNEDYLQFLDEYLDDHLTIEQPEPEFAQISTTETDFDDIDSSPLLVEHGYVVADENFDILRTRSATPGEAWDLQRRSCVYVVKFDTAQKLGYACDQAVNVLEILRK